MREMSISEIKSVELDILKFFHEFCEKKQLKYILTYGSLLGAVRHSGFIPWDDDIDVAMPRKDYEALLSCFHDENNQYRLITPYNWERYPYPFAKIYATFTQLIEDNENMKDPYGVYIDIFPIDELPNNRIRKRLYWTKNSFYRKILNYRCISINRDWSLQKKILFLSAKVVLDRFQPNKVAKKLDETCKDSKSSKMSKCMNSVWHVPSEKPCSTFFYDNRELHRFEDSYFYIPTDYDVWLKNIYGDYMKLPPVEKRMSPHYFRAFDLR